MSERYSVHADATFITADTATMTVRNLGPSTAYYGGPAVTSGTGTSLASGSSVTISTGQYFVTAAGGQAALVVTTGSRVSSTNVTTIVSMTQAAYDALTPDANTLYVITD